MLMPKVYQQSCTALLGPGQLIDHDPAYVNKSGVELSHLAPKLDRVFAYENRWRDDDYEDHGLEIRTNEFLQAAYNEIGEALWDPGCG